VTSLGSLDPRKKAQNSARTGAALVFIGSALTIVAWPPMLSKSQYFFSAEVGLISLMILTVFRKVSTTVSSLIFLANMSAMLFSVTIGNIYLARMNIPFEAFIGFKLVAFALAFIAPLPMALGYLTLSLCAILPLLDFFIFIPDEFKKNIISPEPWTSVLYAIIALGVYLHRGREVSYERKMATAIEEKRTAEERAQKFLAIRDLTNSPLQTIIFTTALLRKNYPDASHLTVRLEESSVKLQELSDILASYDAEAKLNSSEISFDSKAVLKKR
jgi:hypothetical protein